MLVLLIGSSLVIGYLLGSSALHPTVVSSEEGDGESPVEEVSDGDLSAIIAGLVEPCKMVSHFSCWCLTMTKGIAGTGREVRSEDEQRKNCSAVGHFVLFLAFCLIMCVGAGEFNLNNGWPTGQS